MTTAQLDHGTIWYSACNEDGASEITALEPVGKRILCITASGSRAFDLLLADPAEVVAIDMNPAQTALAELFSAAYSDCDYAAFQSLVGLTDSDERMIIFTKLLSHLSPSARAFWERNRPLAQHGLLYCGRWESFLRRFRQWAGYRRRGLADRLLACVTLDDQWQLWQSDWDDWQWRLFLRLLALRPLWRWGLREPGIAFVPADFDMTGYASERFSYAARHLHMGKLPFAWLLLNGKYRQNVLPPYLTEAGHATIGKRIGRLQLRTSGLQETLSSAASRAFDGASLSDYSSYCNLSAQRAVWSELARVITPGGRVCERKFFNKSGANVPLAAGFARDEALETTLNQSDGAIFYTFVVAQQGNRDAG